MTVDTRVDLGGLRLRNPVLTASGTFGYGTEFAPFLDLRRIGGFVAKSLTLEPRIGNPPPRIAEAPSAMLKPAVSAATAASPLANVLGFVILTLPGNQVIGGYSKSLTARYPASQI